MSSSQSRAAISLISIAHSSTPSISTESSDHEPLSRSLSYSHSTSSANGLLEVPRAWTMPTTEESSNSHKHLASQRSIGEQRIGYDLEAPGNPRPERVTRSDIEPASSKDQNGADASSKLPTTVGSLKAIYRSSWLNVLLVFVPVSWALHFALPATNMNATIVFIVSFIAIIPLATLLSWGTEELALYFGDVIGGLLNATFGNVVELIVGVIALTQCKIGVVQSSLIGSMLSNLLLVLGMCFFAGGIRFSEQGFLQTGAQLNTSLLLLSTAALLIPAAYNLVTRGLPVTNTSDRDILSMSHGIAILLLILYLGNLVFQLWSHADLYNSPESLESRFQSSIYPGIVRDRARGLKRKLSRASLAMRMRHQKSAASKNIVDEETQTSSLKDQEIEEDAEETPQLTAFVALGLLAVTSVLVAVTAEFLVSSIDGLTASGHISEEWVGLILLPIVGNATEHFTAVTVSIKDKIDLSIGVAVGSAIQIALFVIPVLVLLAWCLGKPLTLMFDPLESLVLFLAVLTVALCLQDGKSNWLEGKILMFLYLIIAIVFWYYPGTQLTC